jgi:hypothetical protein
MALSLLADAPVEGRSGTEAVLGENTTNPPYAHAATLETINYLVTRQPHRGKDIYILHCEHENLG